MTYMGNTDLDRSGVAVTIPEAPEDKPVKGKKTPKERKQKYNNQEIIDFCKLIAATPDFANSRKHIYSMNRSKGTPPRLLVNYEQTDTDPEFGFDSIKCTYFRSNLDYYVTKNSFIFDRRKTEYIFSYDNIVIDIDNHSDNISVRNLIHDIDRLILLIDWEKQGQVPEFNVVYTGRGAQFWIGLESFPGTLGWLYNWYCRYFVEMFQNIITEYDFPLEIDVAASMNPAGLVRLPFTRNTKRKGFTAKFWKRTDYRYSLDDLSLEFPYQKKTTAPKRKSLKRTTQTANAKGQYTPLHYKRIKFIENLVKASGGMCEGRRDIILFLYYNALVQVCNSSTALSKLYQLNNELKPKPLTNSELRSIITYIDKIGFLPYKPETFLEQLSLSPKERLLWCNTSNDRETKRKEARKAKADRNEQIQELSKQGLTCHQIADKLGCSVETVKRYKPKSDKAQQKQTAERLRKQGLSLKAIADKLGCSPNTVRNMLQQ